MAIRKKLIQEHKEIPIIQRYELLDKIKKLDTFNTVRDQSLISFLYLTACRIEEVVRYVIETSPQRTYRDSKGNLKEAPILDPILAGNPIMKKEIEFRDDNVMLVHNVRILKRNNINQLLKGFRTQTGEIIADGELNAEMGEIRVKERKTVPVVPKKQEIPFIEYIQKYLKTIEEEDYLYSITRQRAGQILSKVGLFPHYLRHLRLTHLVLDYNFNSEALRRFTGWKDARPASYYVHLNVNDIIDMMKK